MLEMRAVRSFIGTEGYIKRGNRFIVANENRFNQLIKWGLAVHPDTPIEGEPQAPLEPIEQDMKEIDLELQRIKAQLAGAVRQVNGQTPDENGNITIVLPDLDTSDLATKTELSNVLDGSPKGVYSTLADLQAAYPEGTQGVYIVTDNGHFYYWDGATWIDGGVYQATGIADNSVTPKMLTDAIVSKNLINKDRITTGKMLNTSGTLADNATYNTTDYIRIEPNTAYTASGTRLLVFYDSNYKSVGYNNPAANVDDYTFTTPENAVYLRLSYLNTPRIADTLQLEEGTTATEYEPFKFEFQSLKISERNFKPGTITGEILQDGIITAEKTNFLNRGKNLFNEAAATPGKYINWTNGAEATNDTYTSSNFMEVEPGKQYSAPIIYHYAFYDDSQTFISGENISGSRNTITAPANAKYVRVSIPSSRVADYQFEEGSAPTEYEPYDTYYLEGVKTQGTENTNIVEPLINIPSTIPAIVGREFNIYFRNIMNKYNFYDVDVTAPEGDQLEKKYVNTFEASKDMPITIRKFENGALKASKDSTVIARADAENTSDYTVLVIGDSTTDSPTAFGKATGALYREFEADTNSDLTLIGTRGTSPDLHEGRSGWTADYYLTREIAGTVTNAFWNPETNSFDFSYYMTQNGFTTPTHVIINLGINDMFSYSTDSAALEQAAAIIGRFNIMIDSIKAFDSTIKVCIALTIPPNASQDTFGSIYNAGQVLWRYKRNNEIFVNELIKTYDNRTDENIYLIPIHLSLNTETDIADGVHPNAAGYEKVGKAYYEFLKALG